MLSGPRKTAQALASDRGFSLLELMVVVGIIATISLIAVPQYRIYKARSLRVEGWNLMNTYYANSISAKAEYGVFPGNFVQVDFRPVGALGYRVTVADGPNANIAINDNACVITTRPCACGGGCGTFKTWVDTGLGTQGNPLLGPMPSPGAVVCGTVAPVSTSATAFSFRASGQIGGGEADVLGMNHLKEQEVCQDGVP